ncbi:hypothetical protein [Blastococcus mobilis]|uniref:Uncharacterized protein n=1 Tax=Blastococcus mobilis TaxID=1938746 RepID=A0A238Z981_9ACTN|nr:hypothetical protein [Blastococcus mobilis]SNR79887.1 hypothetical protein SAMN06272737_12636 [Blastococcus mobilis]
MSEHVAVTAPPRRRLRRWACRSTVLTGLGIGLWLAGTSVASAEEVTPRESLWGTAAQTVDALAPSPALPVAEAVHQVAGTAVAVPETAAAAATAAAAPVTDSVGAVTTPVAEMVRPVAAPVTDAVRDVARPVVAPIRDAILASVREAIFAPARGVLLAATVPAPAGERTEIAGPVVSDSAVSAPQVTPGDTALGPVSPRATTAAAAAFGADPSTVAAKAGAPASAPAWPLPVPVPAVPSTGGGVAAGASNGSDPMPADLTHTPLDAELAAAGICPAAGAHVPVGSAADPCFSPD